MSYQRVLQLGPDDVTAVLFPMYYISAMHAHVLPAMLAGARCVLVDTASPARVRRACSREHRVTWAYAVPSWWRLCLRVPGFARPAARCAGSPPAARRSRPTWSAALRERLPGRAAARRLRAVRDPLPRLHRHRRRRARAPRQRRPAAGLHGGAGARATTARVLPPGEPGELWLRGSLVTTGYALDPEATAAAIVDGWFDTGDVARLDDDGRVTVLDRTKDMINRGGTKIFSAEVEELLRRHPAVEDAAVVGVPDALAGEAVAAFVVALAPVTAGGGARLGARGDGRLRRAQGRRAGRRAAAQRRRQDRQAGAARARGGRTTGAGSVRAA